MQFAIPLSRDGEPLFRQVYRELRQAILCGTLRAGERLPSTRDLAEQLGISRTVVVLAYEQLLAEGFVTGRRGSGTYVSDGLAGNVAQGTRRLARLRLSRFGNTVEGSMATVDTPLQRPVAPRYNFIYGRSDLETFPFAMWRRMLLRQARKGSTRHFDYGSAQGYAELRAAICAHLRRSRAVVCDPSEVIVVNGSQQALAAPFATRFLAGLRAADGVGDSGRHPAAQCSVVRPEVLSSGQPVRSHPGVLSS